MSWLLVIVLIVSVAGAWILPGRVSRAAEKGKSASDKDANTPDESAPPKSRKQIAEALRRLGATPPPPTKRSGAMCYEMAAPPVRQVTYVCPVDGTRTVYATNDGIGYLVDEAVSFRQKAKSWRALGLVATVDESSLCPRCRGGAKTAHLDLLIHFAGEATPVRFPNVTASDMQMVDEFLRGEKVHKLDGPDTMPLRDLLHRLRQILGVETPPPKRN